MGGAASGGNAGLAVVSYSVAKSRRPQLSGHSAHRASVDRIAKDRGTLADGQFRREQNIIFESTLDQFAPRSTSAECKLQISAMLAERGYSGLGLRRAQTRQPFENRPSPEEIFQTWA